MYITFEEYTAMGGTEKDNLAFSRLQTLAEAHINTATFDRVLSMAVVPEKVKFACFEIIEKLRKHGEVSSEKDISRVSNNGVSVDYINASYILKDEEVYNIIRLMLANTLDDKGTPLLYAGVDHATIQ